MDKILKIVEKEIKDSVKEFPERNEGIAYKDAVNIEVEDMHPYVAYDVGYTQGMKCIQQIIKNTNLYK